MRSLYFQDQLLTVVASRYWFGPIIALFFVTGS